MRKLKSDLFGAVWRGEAGDRVFVLRDTGGAHRWSAWLARALCHREARALARLDGLPGTPRLLSTDRRTLRREWIGGRPMQIARPQDPAYFRSARALLARLHRRGIAHNDLAKEANWIVTADGRSALVDFQLALIAPRRGRLFRILGREDIRHLLKHKRSYCPERLTARERRILATPSALSRVWMATGKPAYVFVTRRIFGWSDREGAGDRRFQYRVPMAISNEHNLNAPLPAAKPWGIRVRLRARDPFIRLVGADWQKLHWFATERERDAALADMAVRHPYSRQGDQPAVVYERVSESAMR